MAYDPYSPCPCGSGKKLKFCCQAIADDMERINRLIEDNQLRAAAKQLEAVDKRHPGMEWITTTRALVMIESHESLPARDLLKQWLSAHPDSDFATVLYALAELQTDGYDAAKKPIQRAYQKGARKFPAIISGLAQTVAAVMMSREQPMAARENLSLSLRFAHEDERQTIFMRLLELDHAEDIYYPQRSMHPLPVVEVPAEFDKDYKRAIKLAMIGCGDTAAEHFTALAEKLPDIGELRQSAGLCWAWDGSGLRAAPEFHLAAQKLSDFSVAVECETLGQLFDLAETTDVIKVMAHDAEISSVSRLLTILDDQSHFVRVPLPAERPDEGLRPTAIYQLLDRPQLREDDVESLSLESVPNVSAQAVIFDAQGERSARLVISGMAGAVFDAALDQLKSLGGELLTWSPEQPDDVDDLPRELELFLWKWSFPPKTPLGKRQALEREQWRRILDDRWLNQPQAALGGKSPAEAAKDPAQRIAATAAVYVLDAISERQRHSLDVAAMMSKLGLEPLPKMTLSDDDGLNLLSLMQLHRLEISALNDAQLSAVVNRAMLTHHDAFLRPVLEEGLRRGNCIPEQDLPRAYQTLVDLHAQHGNLADALGWINAARDRLVSQSARFEDQWQWDLRELMLRLTTPTDPALSALVKKFAVYYSPKLPQLRSYLEVILEEAGVASPWDSGGIITPDMASSGTSAGGVWTPEAETATAGGGKLWLPGQ